MEIYLRQQLSSLLMNSSLSNKTSDLPDLLRASTPTLPQNEGSNSLPPLQSNPLITPTISSSDLSSLITTILEHAALSHSKTNIEIVTSLLKNQMPVSKTMIQSILTSHRNNPDLPIDMLVLSKRNDCIITEKATSEFLRFIPSETPVPNELEQLTKEFLTLLDHPDYFETEKDYVAYRNTFMTVITEKSSSLPSFPHGPLTVTEDNLNKTVSSENNNLTPTLTTEKNVPIVTTPISMSTSEQLIPQQTDGPPVYSFPAKESMILSNFFDSPFKQDIKELFLELFSVSPNQLKQSSSTIHQFHSVTEQLKELYVKTEAHLPKEAKERIEVQYEAMKQATSQLPIVSDHCTYLQLPIQLHDQVVPTDLYFIANKKKTMSNAPSFTALLHLNLEHLKNLDICLHLTSNHISASFYSEDDVTSNFLKAHVNQLSDCLSQAGMILNSNFFIRTKQQTALSNLEEHHESFVKTSQFSFDIRT